MKAKLLEDLEVYIKAKEMRLKIFKLTSSFPKIELYRLTDQIIRSTRKCPANIAEGYGRFHYQENIQFCRIARGSLTETKDHLSCALECKYITEETNGDFKSEIETLIRIINGYINYLIKMKESDG